MSRIFLDYLKTGVEPFPDSSFGDGFRCSVYLKDGTYLPCVMLRKSGPTVDLALKRFDQEKKGKGIFGFGQNGYEQVVKSFLTSGNRINNYDVVKVEPSRYAIPLTLLRQIEGETTMSWTGFVLEMSDGTKFSYGTSFGVEFFDLPDQYSFDDVKAVHNHSYVSGNGEVKSLRAQNDERADDYDRSTVHRERPYFTCYYDA